MNYLHIRAARSCNQFECNMLIYNQYCCMYLCNIKLFKPLRSIYFDACITSGTTVLFELQHCQIRHNNELERYHAGTYRMFNLKIYKKNSVAGVCERTIPTESPPLVGEVIANFCG
jgi:hypothetical protein